MGLKLHFIDSISPYVDEILSPLIKKHFSFNLKDTFRIITPDTESANDIEQSLLKDESLGQVLIGRSVIAWENFFDLALHELPNRRPLANFELEAKGLHLAIQKEGYHFGYRTLRLTLQELKRQTFLAQLQSPTGNNRPVHPWAEAYQNWIENKFMNWTPDRAMEEINRAVSQGNCRFFSGVTELFFLGFPYPTANLLKLIRSLKQGYPQIQLYLFLPAPERFHGGESFFHQAWQFLEDLSDDRVYHQNLPLPELDFKLLPTPFHEAQFLWPLLQTSKENFGFLIPPRTTTGKYIYKWSGMGSLEPNNPSRIAWKILDNAVKTKETAPVTFQDFFSKIFPELEKCRISIASLQQTKDLRYFEKFYQLLLSQAQLETYHEELRPVEDWAKFLQEKLEEPSRPSLRANPFGGILRDWKQPGLTDLDHLYISSLNEIAPGRSHGILDLPSTNKFDLFEERFLLQHALFLAKKTATLTWVSHDMTGRVLSPASFLSNLTENLDLPETEVSQIWGYQTHPYFSENIDRESQRINQKPGGDSGNLEFTHIERVIRNKTQTRVLSPSYLDDYAHCPWRFMARWHFRVDTEPEADLEIDPRLKGGWAHLLLERLYQKWQKDYFQLGLVPPSEKITDDLNQTVHELTPQLTNHADIQLNPTVLADEWEKIQKLVGALAQADFTEWRDTEGAFLPAALEWGFGLPPKPQVYISLPDGEKIAIGGKIDRVDFDAVGQRFLVIDYKSSQSDTLSKAIRDELSFQLYLYIQAVSQSLFPKATGVGALYWDLKQLKKNQGMVSKEEYKPGKAKSGNSKTFLKSEEYSQLTHRLRDRLEQMLSQILRGHYQLDPPDCQGPRCPYHEICRYRDQPDV